MFRYLALTSFILFILASAGCELYPQDEFEEQYVVESYLVANRTLPQVRISRTVPVDQRYNFNDAAVNDADVEIRLLDESGETVEDRFSFRRRSNGIYETGNPHKVLPGRTYQLHVTFSNSVEEIEGTTRIPGAFKAENSTEDRITYQDPNQITINTTRSAYPGRQAFFIFTVEAGNPAVENLTPFYADQVNNQDQEIAGYYSNSSGIVNEENYEENEDGTLTLRLPWLAVAFYEENYIIASAIDDNMYDFYRSQDVQTGGSTLPPGELQNIIYNLEGGIGIFGSLASDTVEVFIERN
ncbi:DUF4249 family protein [Halalkalibaculum sp. DA3122]|uniref:DUF4249 family protein n=1 Tax=unclassified Halalkalibaculum TaxID=2964617 RepID=UPI003754AB7A